ncbi:hypothetical protein [Microvirga thermotolerans]|uniref:Uncharacterized protein n=1 Tax=Microvirga thermotolerans TaxID=2651334 RepID=A0A5P9JVL4_9HYPH|nr:hypothetical protein [Microvirga thermotolerans]QFU16239.1 hypothetical protein GDR74_08390 [Microvirga thermotolerans]
MNREDNERHLERVLFREAFERRDAGAGVASAAREAAARAARKRAALKAWLKVRDKLPPLLEDLNRKLVAIGAELRVSEVGAHDYSHRGFPSIGRGRLDLFVDGRKTTRSLEADLAETGTVHLYMYLPKETRRLDIDVAEADADRIAEVLIDFVDLATQDDFPPGSLTGRSP